MGANRVAGLTFVAFLALAGAASAQQGPQFSPTGIVVMPVNDTSAAIPLPSQVGNAVVLDNTANAVPFNFALGNASVSATLPSSTPSTTSYVVPAGAICSYDRGSQNYIAAINGGTAINVNVMTGNGAASNGCNPGGTVTGGAITIPGVALDSTSQAIWAALNNSRSGSSNIYDAITNAAKPVVGAGALQGATVGATSAALTYTTPTVALEFNNNSTTATICLSAASPATISNNQCSAAEIPLRPGASWDAPFGFIPTDIGFAISSAASTPLGIVSK